MSRTVFVNPSFINPAKRKGRKAKKRSGRKGSRRSKGRRYSMRGRVSLVRRNAGIAPFLQNPLILSNPRPRRRRRSNPMALPSMKSVVNLSLSSAGGAAAALTINTVGMSHITHVWGRRAAQAGTALVGGTLIAKKSSNMGSAFAGAMMYPLFQDLMADLLGIGYAAGSATAKEADLDALAADLEDVLDDMDGSELGDDDEEYAW